MTDEERQKALHEGFMLGVIAMYDVHGIDAPVEADAELWRLLEAVAAGEQTLASSPADLLRKFPQAPAALRERLTEATNKQVVLQREIARQILEYHRRVI